MKENLQDFHLVGQLNNGNYNDLSPFKTGTVISNLNSILNDRTFPNIWLVPTWDNSWTDTEKANMVAKWWSFEIEEIEPTGYSLFSMEANKQYRITISTNN